MFVACFTYFLIISDTLKHLTSSCLGSCQLTFHSSLAIQSYARPLKYIVNLNNSSYACAGFLLPHRM